MIDPIIVGAAIGLAVASTALGLIALVEQVVRPSGFGVWLTALLLTTGPLMIELARETVVGDVGRPLLLVSLLAALPPTVAFLSLRIEAGLGGRGDRIISGNPAALEVGAVGTLLVAGAILGVGIASLVEDGGPALVERLPSLVAAANLAVVTVLVFRTQLWRHRMLRCWSLSGVALTTTLASWSLLHATAGVTVASDDLRWRAGAWAAAIVTTGLHAVVLVLHRSSTERWRSLSEPLATGLDETPAPWEAPHDRRGATVPGS